MPKHNRITVSVDLPFQGFCESIWSGMIDDEENQFVEHVAEDDTHRLHDIAKVGGLFDLLFKHTSYTACYQSMARAYVDMFSRVLKDEAGLHVPFEFEEMTSPKFYNFETDRIFAKAPLACFYLMLRRHRRDNYETLASKIKDRHTSRSGFHSYYTNELTEWLEKPLREWDHNELATLLLAFIELETGKPFHEFEMQIYYDWPDGAYHEWETGVDWPVLEAAVEEWRKERDEAERALDPDHKPPAPRCPLTPELFT